MNSPTKKPRRTPEQVIADLQQKQKAAEAAAKKKKSQLQAQIKTQQAKLATAARKEDTHIKIVNGALSFAFFKNHPEIANQYIEWIKNSAEPEETKAKILKKL